MRAVLCKELGPPESLVVEEIDAPSPGPGQVLIDVEAASVNFPDTLIIQGLYQFKADPPFVPGAEAAGTVRAVGEGVTGFSSGDRVMTVGITGGFAEQMVADANGLLPVPDGMDGPTAASLVMAYGTTIYALRERAALRSGESLLVLGAGGGTGLSAVELGAAMGGRVIAAASSDEKLAICREHGASETINYADEDLRERLSDLTGGAGVDVVYDPVGGELAETAIRRMAWKGRYLVIGFASGEIPKIALNLALLKGCSIVGVFWGAFAGREPERNRALIDDLGRLWSEGKIKPHISQTYPLEGAAEALRSMLERSVRGKVVVVP